MLFLILLAGAVLVFVSTANGQDEVLPVVVIDLKGPFDQRLIDFAVETLSETAAHVFILQIDAPGISSGDPGPLYRAIGEATAPVVAWVGARPAVAYGGAGSLLNLSDLGAGAPGTRVGYLEPTVVEGGIAAPIRMDRFRGADETARRADADAITGILQHESVVVDKAIPGFVDEVVPTVGQLIVGLDEVTVTRGDTTFDLSTADENVLDDGTTSLSPSRPVHFVKPGLWDRMLRLAARPDVTLFLLVAAIAAATFEFYAAGPGMAAAASVLAFALAGYGLATLPMSWPSVGAVVAGLLLYTWDFQLTRLGWRSVVGTVALVGGGLTFTSARPQFAPTWWMVLVIAAGAALFYGIALTSIVRSRFSVVAIDRGYLVGRRGTAETTLDPDGTIIVDGARWHGRARTASGVAIGDVIEVVGAEAVVLDVESVGED